MLEIGSVTHSIAIPFTIYINYSYTLTFGSNDPWYDLGFAVVQFDSLPVDPIVSSGGHFVGNLYGKVTVDDIIQVESVVPEPSTIALILAGLISLIGVSALRRRANA